MDGLRIQIEGDSEPAVALALPEVIMRAEGRVEDGADATWILSMYGRCLGAVMGEPAEGLPDEDGENEVAEIRPPV